METKTCTGCVEEKALEYFSRDSRNKTDGRQPRCKACNAEHYRSNRRAKLEYQRDYRHRNREAVLRQKRKHYWTKRDELVEKSREYRQANRETLRAKSRERYRSNRETISNRKREYRKANLKAVRASERARYVSSPDSKKEYGRYHYRANRKAKLEYQREYSRSHREVYRAASQRRRAAKASATVDRFNPAALRTDWEGLNLWGCFFCGCGLTSKNIHEEHFYPLSPRREWRGPHAIWNLIPSCPPCNLSKSDREPWAFLRASLAERGTDLDACLALFDEDGRLIRPTTSVDDEPPPGVTRLTS